MSKKQYIIVFGVMLLTIELITIKLFYTNDALINFKSPFWILHEAYVLMFLIINYFSIKEELGYYDVFLILFPFIGVLVMLIDFSFYRWKVVDAISDEIIHPELLTKKEKAKNKKVIKEEEFDVMGSYDFYSFSEGRLKNYAIKKINDKNAELTDTTNDTQEYENSLREKAEKTKNQNEIVEYLRYLHSKNKFKELVEKYKEFKSKGIELEIPSSIEDIVNLEN